MGFDTIEINLVSQQKCFDLFPILDTRIDTFSSHQVTIFLDTINYFGEEKVKAPELHQISS